MSNIVQSHQEQRKQLWIEAWCSVANANDCKRKSVPTRWADKALKDFDERFKAPQSISKLGR